MNSGAACAALPATVKRLENRTQRDDSRLTVKSQLIAIIAAVLVVGCGPSEAERALHKTAAAGDIEAIKQAIADGADVNVKLGEGGSTSLHFAAAHGRKEIAELLIAEGADMNAKADRDSTPLHWAAKIGQTEIVELLIAKGADVNAKAKYGTPLDRAIKYKQTETADLILKHGGKTGEELKAEGK